MTAATKKVLVILSGADELELQNGKRIKTGFFLVETIVPIAAVINAGYEPVFANPTGKTPAMDPLSDSSMWFGFQQQKYHEAKNLLEKLMAEEEEGKGMKKPRKLHDIGSKDLKEFTGIFLPGGHAPIVDLAKDRDCGRIAAYFARKNRPIGAICHGPAGLLTATDEEGRWPFRGYTMCCWSNWEEKLVETLVLHGAVPLYVESELKNKGACVTNRWPFLPNVVVHNNLLTGQQPSSVPEFSRKMVELLDGR